MTTQQIYPEVSVEAGGMSLTHYRVLIGGITTTGHLVYNEQLKENSGFYPEFSRVNDLLYSPAGFQASTTKDGYVTLLAQHETEQDLLYIVEDGTRNNSSRWARPDHLGMPSGLSKFTATAIHHGRDGLVNIFGTAPDESSKTWWKFQNPNQIMTKEKEVIPPGSHEPILVRVKVAEPPEFIWSGWHELSKAMSVLSAASLSGSRIILAGLDQSGEAWIRAQTAKDAHKVEGWGDWQNIQDGLALFQQVEIASNTGGLISIFARSDNNIYMKQQCRIGECDFTPWALFASLGERLSTIALGTYKNGGLYVVAQAGDRRTGPIFASYQTGESLDRWSPFSLIAADLDCSQLVLQPGSNSDLYLFALSSDRQRLGYIRQITEDFWSVRWTPLACDLENFAVTTDVTPHFT